MSDPETTAPRAPRAVYVVFHNDIEDSKYVRGVFADREAAKARASSVDECLDHRTPEYPHKAYGLSNAPVVSAAECHMSISHSDICCDIQFWEVAT